MHDEQALRAAYTEALFDVEAPDGIATLSISQSKADLPSSLQGRCLTVVTAYNPGAERPGNEANHPSRGGTASGPRRVDGLDRQSSPGRMVPLAARPDVRDVPANGCLLARGTFAHGAVDGVACEMGARGVAGVAADRRKLLGCPVGA